jgi:hypothetical protein
VAELGEDLADLVVHRVHEGDALAVRREALTASRQRVRVAVDADDVGLRAAFEDGLGVPTEAERGVDEQRAVPVGVPQRGRHQGDDPVEENRDVAGLAARDVHRSSCRTRRTGRPVTSVEHRLASGARRTGEPGIARVSRDSRRGRCCGSMTVMDSTPGSLAARVRVGTCCRARGGFA